jgi:hypothetical protein
MYCYCKERTIVQEAREGILHILIIALIHINYLKIRRQQSFLKMQESFSDVRMASVALQQQS